MGSYHETKFERKRKLNYEHLNDLGFGFNKYEFIAIMKILITKYSFYSQL